MYRSGHVLLAYVVLLPKSVAAESIQSSSEGKALAEPRRESRERRPNTRVARLRMGLWHV